MKNPHDPKNDPIGYKEFELGSKRETLIKELDNYKKEENWQFVIEVASDLAVLDAQIELISELWDLD